LLHTHATPLAQVGQHGGGERSHVSQQRTIRWSLLAEVNHFGRLRKLENSSHGAPSNFATKHLFDPLDKLAYPQT